MRIENYEEKVLEFIRRERETFLMDAEEIHTKLENRPFTEDEKAMIRHAFSVGTLVGYGLSKEAK